MEKIIRDITDTARWVAVYRADETERADAVFRDPYARRLAGERGEQVVKAMAEGRKNSWSFIARTYLFDKIIQQHIAEGYEMILNLASGLDARPYRLTLPGELAWVDVDMPGMIDYVKGMMADEMPRCKLERIPLDLSEREARLELFDSLNSRNKKTLVVSEGLVGYLDESEAGALAYDLSHFRNFRHWVLDLMSPGILPLIQEEMGTLLDDAGTPLKFAPAEGEEFFQLFGWKPMASESKLKTALALHRVPAELMDFAQKPEPAGPKGAFPWSGVCVFENKRK